MGNPREPLTLDSTYHIYNHAVGDDLFFREEKNYYFFMGKFCKWILPVADVLSYCLIPNHFHFCLRIKSQAELTLIFQDKLSRKMGMRKMQAPVGEMLERLVMEQFSHCFNSYAQAYNKCYNRMGSLFKESFQRKIIDSDEYLKDIICYIHNNPVNHRLVSHPSHWKHSSFNDLFIDKETIFRKNEVIQIFDNLENLLAVHELASEHPWKPPKNFREQYPNLAS